MTQKSNGDDAKIEELLRSAHEEEQRNLEAALAHGPAEGEDETLSRFRDRILDRTASETRRPMSWLPMSVVAAAAVLLAILALRDSEADPTVPIDRGGSLGAEGEQAPVVVDQFDSFSWDSTGPPGSWYRLEFYDATLPPTAALEPFVVVQDVESSPWSSKSQEVVKWPAKLRLVVVEVNPAGGESVVSVRLYSLR